jgi:ribosome-associated translation inhibitor RaiA
MTGNIESESKAKKKKLLKSGSIRKEAHASSVNKRRQGARDNKLLAEEESTKKTNSKGKVASKSRTASGEEMGSGNSTSKKMRYVGISRSEALDDYVRKQSNGLLQRISVRPNKYKLKFRVSPEARKSDGSIYSFSVEGVVTITGRKELRAKAKDADAKKAIDKVIKALEGKVRRETEKTERSRKTVGKSLKPVKEYLWKLSLDSN